MYTNGDSSTIVAFLQANGAIEDRAGVDERSAFHYSDFGDELAVSFIPLTLLGALSELPAVDFIVRSPIAVPAAISTRAFV